MDAVEPDDAQLMRFIADGDRVSFEKLILKYQRAVYHTAYRYVANAGVAEELAQEVFLRIFRAASTYRPEARFTTWMFTIVKNVCFNYKSRHGKYDTQHDSEIDLSLMSAREKNPEEIMMDRQTEKMVEKAVAGLSATLRIPFILHHYNQLSYEEIAATLELSLSAVKLRIHRARLALVEALHLNKNVTGTR